MFNFLWKIGKPIEIIRKEVTNTPAKLPTLSSAVGRTLAGGAVIKTNNNNTSSSVTLTANKIKTTIPRGKSLGNQRIVKLNTLEKKA